MPIACTRCGASEDGEILTAPIAFAFKHDRGCGHGIGPLAVVKGKTPKKQESKKTESKPKKKKAKELKTGEVPWEDNAESTVSTDTAATPEPLSTTGSTETTN